MQQINITDARDRLPELMNKVYFDEKTFVVTRRGIPMIKIIKADAKNILIKNKKVDIARAVKQASKIQGVWNTEWKDKSSIEIVKLLRERSQLRYVR